MHRKQSKITDVPQFIENNQQNHSPIFNNSDMSNYQIMKSDENKSEYELHFKNLLVLFPNKSTAVIKSVVQNCDTFDAMLNTLLNDGQSVELTPQMVKQDLQQRDIERKTDLTAQINRKSDHKSEKHIKKDVHKSENRSNIHDSELNYPEIFGHKPMTRTEIIQKYNLTDTCSLISNLRQTALENNQKIKMLQPIGRTIKNVYNSDEIARLKNERYRLNRLSVLLILLENRNKMIIRHVDSDHTEHERNIFRNNILRNKIDLHGLYVNEIEAVLSDWLKWRNRYKNYKNTVILRRKSQ
ncbi:hypothetical protein M153_1009300060, partial [Pseudoloma neurophilia]